jgi:hypothetical protein
MDPIPERPSDVTEREVGVVDATGTPRVQTIFMLESKTDKSQAHLGDINFIMKNYGNVNTLQHLEQVDLQFPDISELTEYSDLRRINAETEQAFMQLPAHIREKFDNDPYTWLDVANAAPDQREAWLIQKGLLTAPDPEPAPAEPAPSEPAG